LLQIADDFGENKISIYGKRVDLYEYQVKHLSQNRNRQEVYCRDLRFYWEIYRDRFVYNICLSYYLTKNEKYLNKLFDYLKSWEKFTPLKFANEQYNGMECAVKIINLSWVMVFCSDSLKNNQSAKVQFRDNIFTHASYIYKNYDITTYGLESNHGIACSIGLIYASFIFEEWKETRKWRKMGAGILKRALKNQFSADGVNYESSAQYHRFVFELLMLLLALVIRKNHSIKDWLLPEVKKIGHSLIGLTHTNNYISRIGDSDGGKVFYDLGSTEEFNNLSYLKWFAGSHNHIFETLIFSNVPQLKGFLNNDSERIQYGGYFSIKDKNISLIVTANNIGTRGKGNHQHNDFGAFELYGNKPFIVDPWSYCYTGNADMRNKDRSTFSHNVVSLDNREIVDFNKSDLFEFKGKINIQAEVTNISQGCIEFFVKHAGYHDLLSGGQSVRREFVFDNSLNKIAIRDKLRGCGSHIAKTNMLIPEKYWNLKIEKDRLLFEGSNESFCISSNWDYMEVNKGWSSEMFITRSEAYLVCFKNKYSNNIDLEIIIKNHISSEEF